MGKADAFRVRGRKPMKRNKERLLRKIWRYLKSDHYMFAPLISRPPSPNSADNVFCSSPSGLEIQRPMKQYYEKLVGKFEDFLKSDSYMYASLVFPQPSNPPAGASGYCETATAAVSTRNRPVRSNQPSEHPGDAREAHLPLTSISGQPTVVREHQERVKRVVHQSCHSSRSPDKDTKELPLF